MEEDRGCEGEGDVGVGIAAADSDVVGRRAGGHAVEGHGAPLAVVGLEGQQGVLDEGGGEGHGLAHGEGGGVAEEVGDSLVDGAPGADVGAVNGGGHNLHRGTGDDKVLAFGGGGDDAVAAGVAVDLDGGDAVHEAAVYLTGGGFGRNGETFHRGREGCQVVLKRVLVVLPEDAPCDGVALGGFDGHCAVLKPSISATVITGVVQRHRDHAVGRLAVGGQAGGRDGGQQGALAAQQGAHGAHVVVVGLEGQGGGLGDGDGEEGGVALVVVVAVEDCVEGGGAGAYGLGVAVGVDGHDARVTAAVAQGGAAGGGVVVFGSVVVVEFIHITPWPCISRGVNVKGTTII